FTIEIKSVNAKEALDGGVNAQEALYGGVNAQEALYGGVNVLVPVNRSNMYYHWILRKAYNSCGF
ncbi:hypothetical protein Tco_0473226, partial [Tanacetum coccineum]